MNAALALAPPAAVAGARPGWPGSIYHDAAWARSIESAYGLIPQTLERERRDGGTARLPLYELRTLSGERVGVSAPFSNYGGADTDDPVVEAALLAAAAERARETGWSYLEIKRRGPGAMPPGWQSVDHFVSPVIDLAGLDAEALWLRRVGTKARNQTRLAERRGVTVVEAESPATREFRAVYREAMRDLGTPSHGPRWFAAMQEALGPRLVTLLAYEGTTPIGAALLLEETRGGLLQYCLTLKRRLATCPNHALYWAALRLGAQRGWSYLDLGRSRIDGGTYHFKRQWGAEMVATPYLYYLPPASRRRFLPDQHPSRAGFKPFIETWKRLPLPLSEALGPVIRPHITT